MMVLLTTAIIVCNEHNKAIVEGSTSQVLIVFPFSGKEFC